VLGQMQTFWQIGACLFVIGLVGESFRPANAAAIAFYSLPQNRTRSYSLNRLAINLGFSFGPALGGLLAFQYLFWVDGLTCVLAALCLKAALPNIKAQKKEHSDAEAKASSVWRDAVYLRFTFFTFIAALCFLQMFSIIPLFYKEHLHLDLPVIGLVLGMNGMIIVIIEMVLVFKLEGRRPQIQYISLGTLLMGFSYFMLNLPLEGLSLAIFAMFILTTAEMLMFPFINNFWIGRSKEHNRGQYASIYSMSFACAQVLAPGFGAQIVQHFNYSALWYAIFAICLLTSVGFYSFRKYYR
jgi:predicted MFS family arabinose efflux permease